MIDELTVAGGEDKPLPGLKDVCERGAARGVVVVVAYQSYADVKALYKESGDAVSCMLQNRISSRVDDTPTAELPRRPRQESESGSRSHRMGLRGAGIAVVLTPSATTTTKRTSSPTRILRASRPASPEDGITGHRLSPPPRRSSTPFHLPGDWVAQNLPKRSEDVEPYLQRPDYHQHLEPFSFRDLQRLRLTPPEEEDEAKACAPEGGPFAEPRSAAGRVPGPIGGR